MKVSLIESSAGSLLVALIALCASGAPTAEVARYRRDSSASIDAPRLSNSELSRSERDAQNPKKKFIKKKEKPKTRQMSTEAFEAECLAAHNKWRAMHQAGPLQIDPKIKQFAQKRADFIGASDGAEFRHPDNLPYGENLAWHSNAATSCADLVKMWYDEISMYDFYKGAFSLETGHFTQLVWKSTTRVGCARSISSGPKGGVYLVCNYDPPGNFLGENQENVLPASKKRIAPTSAPVPVPSTQPQPQPQPPLPSTTTTTTTTTTTLAPTSTTSTTATPLSTTAKPKVPKKKNKKNKNKNKNKKNKGKKKNKKKGNNNKKTTTTTVAPITPENAIISSTTLKPAVSSRRSS